MFYYVTVNSINPPGVPIILENGLSVELDLDLDQFITTRVKGDAQNDQLKRLYDIYLGNNKAMNDFQLQYEGM